MAGYRTGLVEKCHREIILDTLIVLVSASQFEYGNVLQEPRVNPSNLSLRKHCVGDCNQTETCLNLLSAIAMGR